MRLNVDKGVSVNIALDVLVDISAWILRHYVIFWRIHFWLLFYLLLWLPWQLWRCLWLLRWCLWLTRRCLLRFRLSPGTSRLACASWLTFDYVKCKRSFWILSHLPLNLLHFFCLANWLLITCNSCRVVSFPFWLEIFLIFMFSGRFLGFGQLHNWLLDFV